MNNELGRKRMEEFTKIVYNADELKKNLNLKAGETSLGWGITYNINFFTQWSDNPFYMHIIELVLNKVHHEWQQKPKNTEDEWVIIFQNTMEKSGLRRI